MLNNINKKKLFIIIGSVVLALLILISIIIGVNLKNKKPNGKVSGKVTDSSLVDSSSQDDSIIDDSSSETDTPLGSSLTDSSETDSSSNTDSSSVASTEKGNTGGNTSTGGSTTGGTTGGKTGGGTSGGGTTGGGSTNPTPTTMTFTVTSFTPLAEINYNTGLGKPVFEYIYGVQRNEGGIPTKYIQQFDKVTLQTNKAVTSVQVSDPNHLEVTFSGNTINVKAKGKYDEVGIWEDYIIVNNNPNYRFNFKIYRYANYNQQGSVIYVSSLCWLNKGNNRYIQNMLQERNETGAVGYTGGDISKSITKKIYLYSSVNMYYDDCIDMDDYPVKRAFNLIEEYHRRGYKNLHINVPLEISNKSLIFIAY